MQQFISLEIPGTFLVNNFTAADDRGVFVKTYHEEKFAAQGIACHFTESYYSVSHQNVIRGMHFQLPPYQHEKMVYVTAGKILDVILDIRTASPTYGKYISLELKGGGDSVFIPKGCAHGFMALTPDATVVYNVTSLYNAEADTGILYNSFGFSWPVSTPVLSARDRNFVAFNNFKSPF
jgi:dTDP-4-dehydrorhamnose 3,5-epimerase